jgi:hypothetical protein
VKATEEENMRLEEDQKVHTDLIASIVPNVMTDVASTDMDVKAAMLGM